MKWRRGRRSSNIEDRRGAKPRGGLVGGGLGTYEDMRSRFQAPGDIDEALNAASAIGDDRLQKQGRGTVVPESFTHGTSEQRQRWFGKGLLSGDPNSCDTFAATSL